MAFRKELQPYKAALKAKRIEELLGNPDASVDEAMNLFEGNSPFVLPTEQNDLMPSSSISKSLSDTSGEISTEKKEWVDVSDTPFGSLLRTLDWVTAVEKEEKSNNPTVVNFRLFTNHPNVEKVILKLFETEKLYQKYIYGLTKGGRITADEVRKRLSRKGVILAPEDKGFEWILARTASRFVSIRQSAVARATNRSNKRIGSGT